MDVETKLYKEAAGLGIVCITLSQRLALPEFHRQELKMSANNADGFELCEVSSGTTTEEE